MGLVLALLAAVALLVVLGIVIAALKWLLIIAAIIVVIGFVTGALPSGRSRSRSRLNR
jgi:hypothetical protein